MHRSTFAMLYALRNKKEINHKVDVNDKSKNIEIIFINIIK